MKKLFSLSILLALTIALFAFPNMPRVYTQKLVAFDESINIFEYVTNHANVMTNQYKVEVWLQDHPEEVISTLDVGRKTLNIHKMWQQEAVVLTFQIGNFPLPVPANSTFLIKVTEIASGQHTMWPLILPDGVQPIVNMGGAIGIPPMNDPGPGFDFVPGQTIPVSPETSIVIDSGTGDDDNFAGAVELNDPPLTPIPNQGFIPTYHKVWRLFGSGVANIKITTSDDWFAYVENGHWVSMQGPLTNEIIEVNLDSKDGNFEHASGSGADPTLPVVLSRFDVAYSVRDNAVELSWITESESQMLGYRIYRSQTADISEALSITPSLVTATNTSNSYEYRYQDKEVEEGIYYYWLEAVSYNNSDFFGPKSVKVEDAQAPDLPMLSTMSNAYPNPFNSSTKIHLKVKGGESGTFTIYNMLGQTVYQKKVSEGEIDIQWNGVDNRGNRCGNGVYFYNLNTPTVNTTKKMIIMK